MLCFHRKLGCKADISSVSSSSEQTEELWRNQRFCYNSRALIYAGRKLKLCIVWKSEYLIGQDIFETM